MEPGTFCLGSTTTTFDAVGVLMAPPGPPLPAGPPSLPPTKGRRPFTRSTLTMATRISPTIEARTPRLAGNVDPDERDRRGPPFEVLPELPVSLRRRGDP